MKQPAAYYRPQTLAEALQYLGRPDTRPLAGGAHLLATEAGRAEAVVDLQAVGLHNLSHTDAALEMGATASLTAVYRYLGQHLPQAAVTPFVQAAILLAGPNTYRNQATLGGLMARRLPDSELLAALLALEVTLTLYLPEPLTLPVAEYLAAATRPDGLITRFILPLGPGAGASHRVARTPKDAPIVSVTGWRAADGAVRLAATGARPRPCRMLRAEAELAQGIDAVTAAAAATCTHPGDFRGSAAYRAEMTAVLTRRVLQDLAPST